ncbi:hypothetical protein C8F04DRAFT_1174777 [Mycena alexandri]|uniref:DUF5648 domain-containing protein n=1 Tax=Mycena alexandri TaxID=1745969 RepID=A0AAD6TD34_9AGAR|nr:hypothetical protein C8F04DRAFT_1174777 [Mycena alexandri]
MYALLTAAYLCITLVSALKISQSAVVITSRTTQTCGDPSNVVPYYRTFSTPLSDYYYTADAALVDAVYVGTGNYALQGVAGLVFIDQEESTVPFYRLTKFEVNFFGANTTERDIAIQQGYGLTSTDPLTYIYPTEICGAVPFYRVVNAAGQANIYTTLESERVDFVTNQGYTDLGIAGYILPLEGAQ